MYMCNKLLALTGYSCASLKLPFAPSPSPVAMLPAEGLPDAHERWAFGDFDAL